MDELADPLDVLGRNGVFLHKPGAELGRCLELGLRWDFHGEVAGDRDVDSMNNPRLAQVYDLVECVGLQDLAIAGDVILV